jgi:glyoxylase-like metal-dependent hydrolase (beta-lactamase superfamily II)
MPFALTLPKMAGMDLTRGLLTCALLGSVFLGSGAASGAEADPPRLYPLTEGGSIFVAVVEDRNTPFLMEAGKILLADTNFERNAEAVQALIDSITPDPVTLVFNSHWHGDHVGGNAFFASHGAITLAHENTRLRMGEQQLNPTTGQVQSEAFAPEYLPVLTFKDEMTIHWGPETVDLVFYPEGHTDSDVVMYFENANALYIGGLLNYPTYAGVYRVPGFLAALDAVLARTDENTRIIPWRGPVIGKAEVAEWRGIIATVAARVETMIAEGKTMEEIVATEPSKEFDAKWGGQRAPARFVEDIYVALTSAN